MGIKEKCKNVVKKGLKICIHRNEQFSSKHLVSCLREGNYADLTLKR